MAGHQCGYWHAYCPLDSRIASSEWQSDGKMEGEVSVEVGVGDGELFLAFEGRIHCFHARIEAHDEEVGVHAESHSVAGSNLFPEGVELKFSSWLVVVAADGPDVAGVDEGGSAQFPEEFGSIFDAEVELYVARLIEEVDALVLSVVCAGA